MKKIFSFVLLTGMLTLMSFGVEKEFPNEGFTIPFGCGEYAANAMIASQDAYGGWSSSQELVSEYWGYVGDCVSAMGNIAPPVFL